jgi:hypothetical protein
MGSLSGQMDEKKMDRRKEEEGKGMLTLTPSRDGVVQPASLCVWLLSLSTKYLRFLQVVACVRVSFLYVAK